MEELAVLLLLALGACDTTAIIEEVNATCVPEEHFDDLFVFVATTSGDVDEVSVRMVLDGDEWSLLPLSEEAEDAWTGEMWGSTAKADCLELEGVVYRFEATGVDGSSDTVELDAETLETL